MSYLQNFKFDIAVDSEKSSKPHIVFLHGVMGSGANWRKIVPEFRKHFQVLTFDQRGHGWSFKPATGYGPEDYAEDLKKILDELAWQKIALVGHSMGGRNALQFAHDNPDRVEALVIEDIGPEGNPGAMDRTIKLIEMVPTPFVNKEAAKQFFAKDFPEKIKDHSQKDILGPYLFTNIEPKPDGTADWRFNKTGILQSLRAGHFKPRWEQVRDLKMPTLFVRGALSQDFSREEFNKVLKVNPHIQGVEVPQAGHWVHFDKPHEFTEVLLNFMRESKVL